MSTPTSTTERSIARADELNRLSYEVRNSNPGSSKTQAGEALAISEELGYKRGVAYALSNLGFHHLQVAENEKSLELLLHSLEIFGELNDEPGIATAEYNLAALQIRYANYNLALVSLNKCITIREKLNDQPGLASCYFQMSFIHDMFGNYEEAHELAQKAMEIRKAIKDNFGMAALMNLMASMHRKRKEYDKARALLDESMRIRGLKDELRGYFATIYQSIELYIACGEPAKAEEQVKLGLEAAEREGEWFGMMRFYQQYGKISMLKKDTAQAKLYYEKAITLAEERKYKSIHYELCELLSELHEHEGNEKLALDYYKKFHRLKQEVLSSQSSSQLKSIQLMNQIDTAKKEAELERIRNIDLKNAYQLIEEKNNDIISSIQYAKRIQFSLLPTEKYIERVLNNRKKPS